MVSIESLISELLLRHNCVIIPSFGGFVAKQTSAVIDFKTGTMQPPRKSLLFNRQLINNDGLLIAELALANKLNYQESSQRVNELVSSWNASLQNGERVSIDKVGYIFLDQERNMCFEQDRFFNLLLDSYGLSKVHFIAEQDVQLAQKLTLEKEVVGSDDVSLGSQTAIVFNAENIESVEKATESRIIEHPELKTRMKPNVWKYVAAACLLPVAFYSFFIPLKSNVLESGMISYKDFNPFYSSKQGIYKMTQNPQAVKFEEGKTLEQQVKELPSDVYIYSYPFNDELYIPIRIKSPNNNITPLGTEQTSSPKHNTIISKFELIAGCFGNVENANNLVSTLKEHGFDAHVLDVINGLSRVSAGGVSDKNAAEKLQTALSSKGYETWILSK